ncbi:MAG: alanine--glyoxylate aminotransferase family protein [bacterium]|nr:alanine--glyoxylate aminotransferase family protein [bacterium]
MPKPRLFAPGPTPIPPRVQAAMAGPIVYHRGPDFPDLLQGVVRGLKATFPTPHDCFVLSSSGSGAMEAALVNICSPDDPVVVVQAGQFGAKWTALCKAYGLPTDIIDLPWGNAFDPKAVADRVRPETRAVFVTQSETSTGVLHDVEALGKELTNTDVLLVVDGVSSVVAHPLPTAEWGVDMAVTASQKGLMVPPGIGIITVSPKAWEAVERARLPRFYFDLNTYKDAFQEGRGPATLPVTLLRGLKIALDMIAEEGLEAVWNRHARHAEAVRQATIALGLSVFAESPSNVLTAISLPEAVDGLALMDRLRSHHGITVGGGLAHLRGRLIRISNLGYVDDTDILTVLSALEQSLRALKWTFQPGAGVGAAEGVLGAEI